MSHLLSLTDAKEQTTDFEYDAYGRVDKVTYPGWRLRELHLRRRRTTRPVVGRLASKVRLLSCR
jgi:YD repeat-containing protein